MADRAYDYSTQTHFLLLSFVATEAENATAMDAYKNGRLCIISAIERLQRSVMSEYFTHLGEVRIQSLTAWSELHFQELFQVSRFARAETDIDKNMSSILMN